MKKGFVKYLVLTFVLSVVTVSTAFAGTNQTSAYQQQQLEQMRQQNEALNQQNEYLKQQTEILKQQTEALKQTQVQGSVHTVQTYSPTQVYAPCPVYYTPPAQVYYAPAQVYSPGPWYGGLAAGYILGQGFRCGHWWGGGCHRCWR